MKLRVYHKCSLLSEIKYHEVATPQEGKRLIEALNQLAGDIIKENHMHITASLGTYSIGLEQQEPSGEWFDWMHPVSGLQIDELEEEDLTTLIL